MESFKKYITETPDYDAWKMSGAPGDNDVNCPACRDGMCPECGGKGGPCQTCKGSGDCPICGGAGEVDKLTAQQYANDHRDFERDLDRDDFGDIGPHPLY